MQPLFFQSIYFLASVCPQMNSAAAEFKFKSKIPDFEREQAEILTTRHTEYIEVFRVPLQRDEADAKIEQRGHLWMGTSYDLVIL